MRSQEKPLKLTPVVNAFLWGLLSLLALSGVLFTSLKPGELGYLPVLGSVLAAMMLFELAYRQWKKKVIEVNFFKVAPYIAIGVGLVILLLFLEKLAA